jgi:hypothetical protein
MMPTRRSFLQQAAVVALASSAPLRAFADDPERELTASERIGLETMASDPEETFSRWIGSAFRVRLRGKAKGTLVLSSVESNVFPHPESDRAQHVTGLGSTEVPVRVAELKATMLHFQRKSSWLEQDAYTLDHDWLGTFDLVLVPSAAQGGPSTCSATLSRMTGNLVLMQPK